MLKQQGTKKNTALVTFELPAAIAVERASVCGDFNAWSPDTHPLAAREDGRFETTIELEVGRVFRFRYLIDGSVWENDWAADGYVPNGFGDDDSIVDLTALEVVTPARRTTKRAATNGAPKAATKAAPKAKASVTKAAPAKSTKSTVVKSTKLAATKSAAKKTPKSTPKS